MARCLLVTVVGLAALSSAGVASAAYDPSLLVGDTSPALGASRPVRIFLRTRQSDEATAVVTIYAPRGYGVKLGHAPGCSSKVRRRGQDPAVGGALQTVEGTIRSAPIQPATSKTRALRACTRPSGCWSSGSRAAHSDCPSTSIA